MYDLSNEKDVVEYIQNATSEHDWNQRCDAVKRANGGRYPDFWYAAIVLSSVMHTVSSKWDK